MQTPVAEKIFQSTANGHQLTRILLGKNMEAKRRNAQSRKKLLSGGLGLGQ
jgi:hypothetical protein